MAFFLRGGGNSSSSSTSAEVQASSNIANESSSLNCCSHPEEDTQTGFKKDHGTLTKGTTLLVSGDDESSASNETFLNSDVSSVIEVCNISDETENGDATLKRSNISSKSVNSSPESTDKLISSIASHKSRFVSSTPNRSLIALPKSSSTSRSGSTSPPPPSTPIRNESLSSTIIKVRSGSSCVTSLNPSQMVTRVLSAEESELLPVVPKRTTSLVPSEKLLPKTLRPNSSLVTTDCCQLGGSNLTSTPSHSTPSVSSTTTTAAGSGEANPQGERPPLARQLAARQSGKSSNPAAARPDMLFNAEEKGVEV